MELVLWTHTPTGCNGSLRCYAAAVWTFSRGDDGGVGLKTNVKHATKTDVYRLNRDGSYNGRPQETQRETLGHQPGRQVTVTPGQKTPRRCRRS